MKKQELITARQEKAASPNTREAAEVRQAKIERDTAEFIESGGKVEQIDSYQAVYPWQK